MASLSPPDPNAFLFMDASHYGWGADLEPIKLSFHGCWTEDQSQLCISILEIMAIHFALKEAIHDSFVMISTDNTTVVSIINKQGGMHSANLFIEVWEILHWCLEQDIFLRIRHIPGKFNILAARLLRLDNLSIQNGPLIKQWQIASFKYSVFPLWICL